MPSLPSIVQDEGIEDIRPVTTVHSFGLGSFVENLAVRRSGQILVTVHNTNELIEIDPFARSPPHVVHQFAANLFGIVEIEEDVFYVSTGTIGQQQSFAIFKVDMSTVSTTGEASPSPRISKVVDVPEALFLNGSAVLNTAKGLFLVADSIVGAVFAIDTQTATVKKWLQHQALNKVSEDPNYPGVNGIKMHNGYLYLSNTEARTFLRASLTEAGDAIGSVEVVHDKRLFDDFAFDAEGSAYLTTHIFNSVVKVRSDGAPSRIAGGPDDAVVAGTTTVAFGRTPQDETTLYVTTNGGMTNPVHGKLEPARLLSLQIGSTDAPDQRP
ncbi:hypothetical protein MMC09_001231 [Bachmanniomyces sp. S44760]|nr:hypothetical protein [Bachmanniomyces sp. S44760]